VSERMHHDGRLNGLPNHLDPKTRIYAAVIEAPKGCRNKFPMSNIIDVSWGDG